MTSLRQKLTLAFGGLLIILTSVGVLSGLLLTQYSSTLERLFRENYNSVVYAQNMKDAIDNLNELAWDQSFDASRIQDLVQQFESNLIQEKSNITLPGEHEMALELEAAWKEYRTGYLQKAEGASLRPFSLRIKELAQKIIDLNLANIVSVDGQVREKAIFARNAMGFLVTSGVVLAIIFTFLIGRSILKPLQSLTRSVREIEQGNLDLAVSVTSRDELGQLADAFNAMAVKLREYRRSDRAKLIRAQKTTQLALNTFPDAVAIVGLDGRIELANEAAIQRFRLIPEARIADSQVNSLAEIFEEVCRSFTPFHPSGYDKAIQTFIDGREHFYLPQGVPILSEDKQLTGVTLVLTDVTDLRRLDEMKSGLLSVASHELKTPLTSLRMSTHLLLEERVGPLTPQQLDLLITARDDAERLNAIIENLLDISRIESGRVLMELKPIAAEQLVQDAIQQFATAYRDRGVTLVSDVESDIQDVLADPTRIGHVFSNLLDNALKYTGGGGRVVLSAKKEDGLVRFSVEDSGVGISADALTRIFEKFYRSPDQPSDVKGAGLGLAIAREIVEAHGGQITAQSQWKQGTIISFTLKGVHHG